ncbi:unnamed protein product [Adineta steineri]|uniref:Uncharacterized protein n=1 Tax=Adineta steineri TaxID=433720 RepID=A0A814FQ89_9BILA|nr:unnamed protein product [Adineta steineri]CAF4277899.1 unnamed protein product [Adineta steineri]
MSESKQWPDLVGKSFDEASKTITAYKSDLNPYNAKNGVQDRMFDPQRVVLVTDDNDIVKEVPSYTAHE